MRKLLMLRAIQAFEAAARHGNYLGAATELSVTPAAVGQQVRALEGWLGAPLFRRLTSGANRLILTDAAAAALPEFKLGFDQLDLGLRRLRQGQRPLVTIAVSQGFVARWLLPRLDRFAAAWPQVEVRLDVSDRLADIEHGEADLGIRCGPGEWRGVLAKRLMDEEVFPVCSPSLLDGAHGPTNASELARMPLIHDLTMPQAGVFPSWSDWLGKQEVRLPKGVQGLQINSSAAVVQAALNGQGVALARRAFVSDELRAGRLVRLLPEVQWAIRWAYYVVHTESAASREPVNAFIEWLAEEAAADLDELELAPSAASAKRPVRSSGARRPSATAKHKR
jgi:LysR family glycine cleavage system transcriptional activator